MKTQLSAILLCIAVVSCNSSTDNVSSGTITTDSTVAPPKGHWLDSLDILAERDSCGIRIKQQLQRLKLDTFDYKLENYPATACDLKKLAALDPKSSSSARTFKTKISEALRDSGINFAGCYSLVNVPMTGAGDNYWIVDRRNGKTTEFPYKAVYITFSKESNLVIINPKEKILAAMREAEDPYFACAYINTGDPLLYTDLQPHYLLWKDGSWQVLAPRGVPAPVNRFWKDNFGR